MFYSYCCCFIPQIPFLKWTAPSKWEKGGSERKKEKERVKRILLKVTMLQQLLIKIRDHLHEGESCCEKWEDEELFSWFKLDIGCIRESHKKSDDYWWFSCFSSLLYLIPSDLVIVLWSLRYDLQQQSHHVIPMLKDFTTTWYRATTNWSVQLLMSLNL